MSERPHKWRDIAWKRAIADGARNAIEYFMPDLAADMDTSREATGIIDMELPLEGSGSDKDMRVSDVFLSVPLIGGEEWNVACFAEQQHEKDDSFGTRMFDSYVRLRAQRQAGRTTGFVIYTGNSKGVNSYAESCYGFEASIKFRTFHLPSYSAEELKADKRPFALVLYAGLLSLGSEKNVALRETYAWELLNMITEQEYDKKERKFILEFVDRIFWLSDPEISRGLKEECRMLKTIPLDEYVRLLDKEEARMEGEENKAFEVARKMLARKMPVSDIIDLTGLDEDDILALS